MERLTEAEKDLMDAAETWRPFLIRRLGDPERADEAVQLVREKVWFARDRFDPERGNPRVWVGGFARLIAMEQVRAIREAREATSVTWDSIGVGSDDQASDSVDDDRRLLQMVARHVDARDWEVISTHAYARSTANAEAKSLGISVDAYRAALQRVQGIAETIRSVLLLTDGGGDHSRESLKACVSPRLGVADVLPWMDQENAAKVTAAELSIRVSVARNRLSIARRLLAVAESVAGEVG